MKFLLNFAFGFTSTAFIILTMGMLAGFVWACILLGWDIAKLRAEQRRTDAKVLKTLQTYVDMTKQP